VISQRYSAGRFSFVGNLNTLRFMGRIRTIKPEFWTSEQIVECSPIARLLFIGIWNFCDDGGNHPASAKSLKMQVFPGDEFSVREIELLVDELIINGLLVTYAVGDEKIYWHVTGWHHQKIDRPSFKYPKFDEHSTNIRRAPPPGEESNGREWKGREGKGREGKNRQHEKKSDMVSPETEIEEMKKDDLCKERFVRVEQLPAERYGGMLDEFFLRVKSEKHVHSSSSDFRNHFFSWARLSASAGHTSPAKNGRAGIVSYKNGRQDLNEKQAF
jgi:hypothetical protein